MPKRNIETAEDVDKLVQNMESALRDIQKHQRHPVKRKIAEATLLDTFEEARDLMKSLLADKDRSRLADFFGNDCRRIARIRTVLDSSEFSQMFKDDQRKPECLRQCLAVETVLSAQLGLADALQEAKETQASTEAAIASEQLQSTVDTANDILQQLGVDNQEMKAMSISLPLSTLRTMGSREEMGTRRHADVIRGDLSSGLHFRVGLVPAAPETAAAASKIEGGTTTKQMAFMVKPQSHANDSAAEPATGASSVKPLPVSVEMSGLSEDVTSGQSWQSIARQAMSFTVAPAKQPKTETTGGDMRTDLDFIVATPAGENESKMVSGKVAARLNFIVSSDDVEAGSGQPDPVDRDIFDATVTFSHSGSGSKPEGSALAAAAKVAELRFKVSAAKKDSGEGWQGETTKALVAAVIASAAKAVPELSGIGRVDEGEESHQATMVDVTPAPEPKEPEVPPEPENGEDMPDMPTIRVRPRSKSKPAAAPDDAPGADGVPPKEGETGSAEPSSSAGAHEATSGFSIKPIPGGKADAEADSSAKAEPPGESGSAEPSSTSGTHQASSGFSIKPIPAGGKADAAADSGATARKPGSIDPASTGTAAVVNGSAGKESTRDAPIASGKAHVEEPAQGHAKVVEGASKTEAGPPKAAPFNPPARPPPAPKSGAMVATASGPVVVPASRRPSGRGEYVESGTAEVLTPEEHEALSQSILSGQFSKDAQTVWHQVVAEGGRQASQGLSARDGSLLKFVNRVFDSHALPTITEEQLQIMITTFSRQTYTFTVTECISFIEMLTVDIYQISGGYLARVAAVHGGAVGDLCDYLFRSIDVERTGALGWNNGQVRTFIKEMTKHLKLPDPSEAQMFAIYRTYDVDDSGALDIDETRRLAETLSQSHYSTSSSSRASTLNCPVGHPMTIAAPDKSRPTKCTVCGTSTQGETVWECAHCSTTTCLKCGKVAMKAQEDLANANVVRVQATASTSAASFAGRRSTTSTTTTMGRESSTAYQHSRESGKEAYRSTETASHHHEHQRVQVRRVHQQVVERLVEQVVQVTTTYSASGQQMQQTSQVIEKRYSDGHRST